MKQDNHVQPAASPTDLPSRLVQTHGHFARSMAPRPLRQVVEQALRHHNIAPSRLGREAVKDPAFVFNLRNGREPRPSTENKVRHYLARLEVADA